MCGIAGIIRITPPIAPHLAHSAQVPIAAPAALSRTPWQAIPESWLDTLDNSIKHRGPDGAGRFRDRAIRSDGAIVDVALVHRRLSIIDHTGGHQPMVSLGKGQGVITDTKRFGLGDGLGLYEPSEYSIDLSRAAQAAGGGVGNDERGQSSYAQPEGLRPGGFGSDRIAVIFNGCIYNHRELRKQLETAGHVFTTDHSDTEVLVHGWREWGERLPEYLDGMYALAVWDSATAQLYFARDRAGEKPLYFCEEVLPTGTDVTVPSVIAAFASTVPGVAALSRFSTDSTYSEELGLQTKCWIPHGYQPMRWNGPPQLEIEEVPPCTPDYVGHVPQECEPFKLGSLPKLTVSSERSARSLQLTAETVDRLLSESVATRVDADVPVGVFLSGGTDSSILAAMTHLIRSDIHAFTVRMPTFDHDESAAAAQIARHIGINHTIVDCDAHPAEDLLRLIPQLGLPFGDSSLLPVYWVSKAARQFVKVALSGDGADELFGGYQRYQAARWLRQWRWLMCLIPSALLSQSDPKSHWTKIARLGRAARGNGYSDLTAIFGHADSKHLMPGSLEAAHYYNRRVLADPLIDDFLNYLPRDLLRKTDTASMSVPLEVRCPYLSRDLIQACTTARLDSLMPNHERKGLLRAVARKYFPAEIVDRPKMGFAIPIGEWFRTNFGGMRDLLYGHLNAAGPFGPPMNLDLDMDFIRQMLREHDLAGKKSIWPWKGRDHSQRLYMLLVLAIWAKTVGGRK